MEDVAIALDVEAVGDATIKKNRARARTAPINKRGNSPTLITKGSQAAGIVAVEET